MGLNDLKTAREDSKDKRFIDLSQDGATCRVCLPFNGKEPSDEPYVTTRFYNEKTETYEDYSAEHKATGKKAEVQAHWTAVQKIKFVDAEGVAKTVYERRILRLSLAATDGVVAEHEKRDGLGRCFIDITRHGLKMKTKWDVRFDDRLTEEEIKVVAATERFNLAEETKFDRRDDSKPRANSGAASSGGAMTDEQGDKILAVLRELPEERRKAFLTHFALTKVRELPASKYADAMAFAKGTESSDRAFE